MAKSVFPEDEWHPVTGVRGLTPLSPPTSPGNVFNLEINLVQSGAPQKSLFDTISGCKYMSFSLNGCVSLKQDFTFP